MVIIVDFGSQTTHLISRRLKELHTQTLIIHPENAIEEIKKINPNGIVLSGGPASVYEDGAPTIDPKIFSLGIPILGICYGLQLTAHLLGGKVISGKKEYGPATLKIKDERLKMKDKDFSSNLISQLSSGLPQKSIVWMSHGDEVVSLPDGFEVIGSTEHVPFAFVEDKKRKIVGLQFHPEVEHTEGGTAILQNFVTFCEAPKHIHTIGVEKIIAEIKEKVGEAYVVGAVSGGVDSTVAGVLTARAIGKQFVPVYVDNGLMRVGTTEHVKKIFTHTGHVEPIVLEVEETMLQRLAGIDDPEQKRKIIGNYYIELFEQEMEKLVKSGKPVKFLLQGTIYSDVIESQGTKHAAKIKSHHNVGGLPENMKLELLEPLRQYYKDEVRLIGSSLGLPDEFVHRQVFPGPGYAIRIRGEVNKDRLEQERLADAIILEELEKAGWLEKVYMSFPIMTGALSTAVKGDGRFFGEVLALRVVQSKDVMTSTWAPLPYDLLQKLSSRIVNEVPGISRVVYDISTKPPATMEWE